MYIPHANRMDDRDVLVPFMQQNDFATIISNGADGVPAISYGPVLSHIRGDAIWVEFHLARANGHTALLSAGATTTLAFHGPHAFVHPAWYAAEHAVPTWNYAVVHATGTPAVIETLQDSLAMVNALTHFYDASHPAYTEEGVAGMLRGIICYRMQVTTLEGKFKLSQNRSLADRVGVRTQLAQSPRERERDLAAMMRASEPVTE